MSVVKKIQTTSKKIWEKTLVCKLKQNKFRLHYGKYKLLIRRVGDNFKMAVTFEKLRIYALFGNLFGRHLKTNTVNATNEMVVGVS